MNIGELFKDRHHIVIVLDTMQAYPWHNKLIRYRVQIIWLVHMPEKSYVQRSISHLPISSENNLSNPPLPPFSKGGYLFYPFEKGGLRGIIFMRLCEPWLMTVHSKIPVVGWALPTIARPIRWAVPTLRLLLTPTFPILLFKPVNNLPFLHKPQFFSPVCLS